MPLNKAAYDLLLSNNPTKLYGVHDDRIYDFTGLYVILGIVPLVQDVTCYNTEMVVSGGIMTSAPSRVGSGGTGFEAGIFDIIDEEVGVPSAWNVVMVDTYISIDEDGFDLIKSLNPTRFYGIYNTTIYDFTGLYPILSLTPPSKDVRIYNTTGAVATAIDMKKGTVGGSGAEQNIFDILNGTALAAWGVLIVDRYNPTKTYTNQEIEDTFFGDSNKYIVRIVDDYYDISFGIVQLTNFTTPPKYVNNYPNTASVGGLGVIALPNTTIYSNVITNSTLDSFDMITGGPVIDFLSCDPIVTKIGRAAPWVTINNVLTNSSTEFGIFTALSKNGTTMAVCYKSIPTNPLSTIKVNVYRQQLNTWSLKATINTSIVIDVSSLVIADIDYGKLVSISDNGLIMAIGDRRANSNDGVVRIYDYNGTTWILRSTIPGANALAKGFGYSVALSGNGLIFATVINDVFIDKSVGVYGYNGVSWTNLTGDLSANSNLTIPSNGDEFGYGISLNFDGTRLAVGDTQTNTVRIYQRVASTYTVIGSTITAISFVGIRFGVSVDLNTDGKFLVVGDPEAQHYIPGDQGIVLVYNEVANVWNQVGNPILGELIPAVGFSNQPNSGRMGYPVSINSNGTRIAAGGRIQIKPGILKNVGYVRVFEYDSTSMLWLPVGQKIKSLMPEVNDYGFSSEISGSGTIVAIGAPGFNPSPTLGEVRTVGSCFITLNSVPNGTILKEMNNPIPISVSASGTLSSINGTSPEYFIINGITNVLSKNGLYGTLSVNQLSGAYTYTPNQSTIPNTLGTFNDIFTFVVVDTSISGFECRSETSYIVRITVTEAADLATIGSFAKISKYVNGTTVSELNTTGTLTLKLAGTDPVDLPVSVDAILIKSNGTIIQSSVVPGGVRIPIGPSNLNGSLFISGGTKTITSNLTSYPYIYTYNPAQITSFTEPIIFTESFMFVVRDSSGSMEQLPYDVKFCINPKLLCSSVDKPNAFEPSIGTITRIDGKTDPPLVDGLGGVLKPTGGAGGYKFGIVGGTGSSIITQTKAFGFLTINNTTGEYNYNILTHPTSIGTVENNFKVGEDIFDMTITDAESTTLICTYKVIFYTMPNTTPPILGTLPEFSDEETSTKIRFWSSIIHDLTVDVGQYIQEFTQSSEIFVVGEVDKINDFKNPNAILRELLTKARETSSVSSGTGALDVLDQIRFNTKDKLDTLERAGSLTYSFIFEPLSGQFKSTELADLLSNDHSSFMLNRYRSNVGEAVLVIYYWDSVVSVLDKIAAQANLLIEAGVENVILVITGMTLSNLNNNGAAIQAQENLMVSKINSTSIIKSSVRYDDATKKYINIFSPSYQITPETVVLFNAIGEIVPTPTESRALRIIITAKFLSASTPYLTGEILYGATTDFRGRVFKTSRSSASTITIDGYVDTSNPKILYIYNNISGLNVGDVLYNQTGSGRSFNASNGRIIQFAKIELLMSVVSGYDTPIIGQKLYMTIDDGFKLNNPLFTATVDSIIARYNSNTLVVDTSPPDQIVHGFDYRLMVTMPTGITVDANAAAPIEEYIKYPRLGLVTLFGGKDKEFAAYGRGIVLKALV